MIVQEYPASVGQRLLFMLQHYRTGLAALNCPVICKLEGELHHSALRAAVADLIARHGALRTTFFRREHRLWQSLHEADDAVDLKIHDLRGVAGGEEDALKQLSLETETHIDPSDPPFRVRLWQISATRHLLLLNASHLVSDAWSGWIQIRDLILLYRIRLGDTVALPPAGLSYVDYVKGEEQYLRGLAHDRDLSFWRANLDGATFDAIPFDIPTTPGPRRTQQLRMSFDAVLAAKLVSVSRKFRTTVFNLLLCVFFAAMHRLTKRDRLEICSVFANRVRPELQNTVGYFANLVGLRSGRQGEPTWQSFLGASHRYLLESILHQSCPFHSIASSLTGKSGIRPDQAVFQMLPRSLDEWQAGPLRVAMITPEVLGGRFDFETTVLFERQRLTVLLSWNRDVLSGAWVNNLAAHIRACMAEVAGEINGAPF